LTGVAENVTGIPEQTGLVEALIETLTGILALTVMVIVFEMAGLPVAQVASEFNTHFTWSLLTGLY
jgi:hypothetical protein